MIVKELATETSTMKRMGMNIGLILLSVCLAGLSFELLVYMGTRYSGIYWMVQHGSNILLAVLLLFWLRIIWIRFSGWRYGDITFTKIAYGSPDATLEQLIDERNFKLLRDYKAQHIRKYRNQINGEMVLVTYERPKLRVKKGGCLKRLICVGLIAVLLIPCAAVSRLGQWNQKLETMLKLPESQSMTYFVDGQTDQQIDAGSFLSNLREDCVTWFTGLSSHFHWGNRDQYIFPDSDRKELTESDIAGMDTAAIQMAINEIYARKGYSFSADSEAARAAREYFMSKDWYSPTIDTMEEIERLFSEVEQKNVIFLAKHRN